ncbi:MAG: BEN domain-containing protein [Proteobacteria bacterium]|nr:BEN domain-containing protein [Pseudomonadota bacterium]
MPIKTAEEIVARYPNYLNEDNIGRLATKLARFTYFGENVLAQSTVPGGVDKHPLNPVILLQMKNMLKGQFPNESPTDFEIKWAKCVDSINRVCKYIYNTK